MQAIFWTAMVILAALAAYLSFWPVPVAPVSWQAPSDNGCTGLVLEYDPARKTTRIVARGFSFANGVALSRDEAFLFVTEDGQIVADLQDPAGTYPETTAITETRDRLYVQSLHADTIGWLPR